MCTCKTCQGKGIIKETDPVDHTYEYYCFPCSGTGQTPEQRRFAKAEKAVDEAWEKFKC